MFFLKKKKKKDAAKKAAAEAAAQQSADKKEAPAAESAPAASEDTGARRSAQQNGKEQTGPLLGAEHPLMQLASRTMPLTTIRREPDLYGNAEDEPFCFAEYEETAIQRTRELDDAMEELDAVANVWISPDHMQAWISVFPPSKEGAPVTPELVSAALSAKNVKGGLDEDAIRKAGTPEGYHLLIQVAQGQEAVDGENGRVISLIEDLDPSWKKDPNGKINFAEWDWIVNVDAEEKIAEIIPPTEGTNGFDVLGKETRAKNGRPAPRPNGKGTSFIEDGRFLKADNAGQLLQLGDKFTVNEVLTIKGDVDYSTGNINSNSTVVINGNIKPNFKVESKQDIVVKGTVEWATLIAGHDITVTGGITGGDDDYIQAGNDIRCKFMENGRATCGGDAYFENLVLSDVNAEGSVYVTSGRGTIISGTVTAMNLIKAGTIGNRSYRATEVRIAQTPNFAKRLDRCTAELEKARNDVKSGNEKINQLTRSGDPKLMAAVQSQKSLVAIASTKKANMEGRCDALLEKARQVKRGKVEADTVYPNVTVAIGNDSMVTKYEAKYASFYLRNHEIKMGSN